MCPFLQCPAVKRCFTGHCRTHDEYGLRYNLDIFMLSPAFEIDFSFSVRGTGSIQKYGALSGIFGMRQVRS